MIAKTIRTCFPIAAAAVSDKAEEIKAKLEEAGAAVTLK